jgi:hypothetical protein
MNEYKTYKALVKHKRKIYRVFYEVCGDKSFPSRRPGRKLKIPAVVVASCSVTPPKAPRRRSSKSGLATADETTSSGIQPTKTKSLESSKRKRKSSEQISDAKLQAASSLAQISRKKPKKAVKKVVSSGVRRVPSAFDDNLFIERVSQKGSYFWPLLRFNFREHCSSGSENEFMDNDSFSDATPEVQKEVIPDAATKPLLLLLLLLFLSLTTLTMKHLLILARSLNSPFTGVKIPSKMPPCSKFVRKYLKAKLPLLPWLHLTRALVRLC